MFVESPMRQRALPGRIPSSRSRVGSQEVAANAAFSGPPLGLRGLRASLMGPCANRRRLKRLIDGLPSLEL